LIKKVGVYSGFGLGRIQNPVNKQEKVSCFKSV
jgi:hypothetical protein